MNPNLQRRLTYQARAARRRAQQRFLIQRPPVATPNVIRNLIAAPLPRAVGNNGELEDIKYENYGSRGRPGLAKLKQRFLQLHARRSNSFTFSISDLDYDFTLLLNFIPAGGNFILKTSNGRYVTINQANVRAIMTSLNQTMMREILDLGDDEPGSGLSFVQALTGTGLMTVLTPNSRQFQQRRQQILRNYNRRRGQWFPYAHNIEGLDLEEYQIFHLEDQQTDETQCLIYTLQRTPNCPTDLVNYLKTIVAEKANSVSAYRLSTVCSKYDTELEVITLKKRTQAADSAWTKRKIFYPKKNSGLANKVKVCLHAGHYFVYHKNTGVYKWALQNPQKAYEISQTINQSETLDPKHWTNCHYRDDRPCLDSFNLIRFLLESLHGDGVKYLVELNRSQQTSRLRNYLKLKHEYRQLDLCEEDAAPYGVRPGVDETVAEAVDRVNLQKEKNSSGEGRPKAQKMMFAFDFETTTDGDVHVPYLVSVQRIMPTQFEVSLDQLALESSEFKVHTFYGKDSGDKMLQHISRVWKLHKNDFRGGVQLIAHNAGYDIRFLFAYFSKLFIPKLTRGSLGRLKSLTALYVYDKDKLDKAMKTSSYLKTAQRKRKQQEGKSNDGVPANAVGIKFGSKSDHSLIVTVHDSLNFTMCSLSSFPKMFNLGPIVKEIMPYDAYTNELFSRDPDDPTFGMRPLSLLKETLANSVLQSPKNLYAKVNQEQGCTSQDVKVAAAAYSDQFESNARQWGCIQTLLNEEHVDLQRYARVYCERDVEILAKGYCKLRHMFHKVSNGINIDDCVSVNQLTNKALQNYGCTEGVMELSGVSRDFIQQCVTGGKCMLRNNQKQKVSGKVIADFDAVSLYPSAMAEMPGLLLGGPKVIPEGTTVLELEQVTDCGRKGAWFAEVEITSVEEKWQMPICNYYCHEEHKRVFTNEMVGRRMWCSSVTVQDMAQMQGIKVQVKKGYYFDEGYNTKLKDFITNIFNERLKMKKDKNPMQLVYKLMMNGAYGRLILKPIETDNTFFPSSREFQRYLTQNWQLIKDFEEMPTDSEFSHCVQLYKEIYRHWSAPHLGVMILDHSKRIMNRLHDIAHDLKLPIYYMDTDSMHLLDEDIKTMRQEFSRRYPTINNGELIGKNLGQFHNDFGISPVGPISLPKFDDKDIRSDSFIAYGKKCYLHSLNAPMKDAPGKLVKGHAMAMKGFTVNSVYDVCNENAITLTQLFNNVYNGEKYKANLLAGGKVSFEFNKQMQVKSRTTMKRTIQCIV